MNRFTQPELIEFVKNLIDSTNTELKESLSDPIAIKYLQKMQADVRELEDTRATILKDGIGLDILEADRVRDRALSVFRRLMQVYEMSEDNSPEAVAYEELNQIWMKKYDALQYLNLAVETEGIDNLLFDLSTERYAPYVESLKLKETVAKIRKTNEDFKVIYASSIDENHRKSTYDARALHMDLMETIQQYDDYVSVLSRSSENNKEMIALQSILKESKRLHQNQASNRHGKLVLES